MRLVIQRVSEAAVAVPAESYESRIGNGLLVLAAFIDEDTEEDLDWTVRKITAMRIFDDAEGNLKEEYASDDSHIESICYTNWCDWLQNHTIIK